MASLRAASRTQHPVNGQKASSFAPASQAAPMAYHMMPEQPDPFVPQRVQRTQQKKGAGFKMHAPGKRGR